MDHKEWMNKKLPNLVEALEESINQEFHVDRAIHLGRSGRAEIYEVLDSLLSVLFPGCYCSGKPEDEDLHFFLSDELRHISLKMTRHLTDLFASREKEKNRDAVKAKAQQVIQDLIESLPEIREMLLEDIRTAYEGDPSAASYDEIVLSYPFIDAVATHRIAHKLYEDGVPIIPRIMNERAHSRTGIDIHPGASIAPGFFIDHGTGVVIGETCVIGRNVKIYQGVTLGALSPFDKDGVPKRGIKRHPNIEDDVIIYANATILGGNTTIGKGAVIGGNTWITESIAPGTLVYRQCLVPNCRPKDGPSDSSR